MDKLIQQIWMLTLLFTLCGGFMLVFRRFFIGGSGRTVKRLWAVVMFLAVLPLYILPITLPGKGQPQRQIVPWLTVSESTLVDRLAGQILASDATDNMASESDLAASGETGEQNTTGEKDTADVTQIAEQETPQEHIRQLLHIAEGVVLGAWACGAVGFVLKHQYGKHKLLRGWKRFSHPCRDGEWTRLLQACADRVGVRRAVELRIIEATMPRVSPCIVGWCKPKLYVHSSHLNEPLQAEEIFMHELQHLRSMDALYKNISCMVMAIHWFNPITYLVWPRLLEDCELSCDSRTLEVLGEERRISYMKTILNVAATTGRPKRAGRAALYFCEPSGKQTLKRRYQNVARLHQRPAVRILSLCLAAVMIFACVGCQLVGKKKDTIHLLTPLTEEMVRFYYDLSPEDEITQEMLDGVTSLFVYRDMNIVNAIRGHEPNEYYPDIPVTEEYPFEGQRYTIDELGEFTILNFEVNYADTEDSFAAARNQGDPMHMIGCMNYVRRNYMETVIFPTVEKEFEGYVDARGRDDGEYMYKRFKAYWILKDQNVLTNERQKMEILEAFPGCDDYPYYVFDPTASTAELMRLYVFMGHAGLLDNRILADGTIDPDIFKVFPNLTDLHIVGIPQA